MTAAEIFDDLFGQMRTPRSEAYKAGALAALKLHLERVRSVCLYPAGSAEFDAYYAGWMEGRAAADQAVRKVLAV